MCFYNCIVINLIFKEKLDFKLFYVYLVNIYKLCIVIVLGIKRIDK